MICNMCPRYGTCYEAKNGCENCDIGQKFEELLALINIGRYGPDDNSPESEALELINDSAIKILEKFSYGEPQYLITGRVFPYQKTYRLKNLFDDKKTLIISVEFIEKEFPNAKKTK